jgi:NRAMP (natural resistance-associated macrophage protein)-like metal ion transporter
LLSLMGPGLVTGASDDDPSGIATYSQVGAQYGYGMLWTLLFSYPLMATIQEVAARIGRTTGHGIAGNARRHYPKWFLYAIVFLVLLANVINLGADIGSMGGAVRLLVGGPALLYSALFAALSLAFQAFIPYHRYVKLLKWLSLALFAYVGTVFVVHVPWGEVLRRTAIPEMSLDPKRIVALVGVLGTTISPYLFFWQASEEVEELNVNVGEDRLRKDPSEAPEQLSRIRTDTYMGMGFSNLVAFFIMVAVAATLHARGVTEIASAEQAAEALRPVGGQFAFLLFAAGIVGTGLLAVPVLAGSAAYAVGEALRWPVGLERKVLQAKGFYAVMAASILLGLLLNLFHVDPIKALFWAAVVNGVAAGPIMVVMMQMASNPRVMGQFTIEPRHKVVGWLSTAVMIGSALAMFALWGK